MPPGRGANAGDQCAQNRSGHTAEHGFWQQDPLPLSLEERYVDLLRRVLDDPGRDIYVPDYDRGIDEPVAARHLVPPAARLVITEGNYLACDLPGWREARASMARRWYLEAPADVRRERLLERQVTGGQDETRARARVGTNDIPNGDLVATWRGRCVRILTTIGMDMFN